jgi:hypothetical protein
VCVILDSPLTKSPIDDCFSTKTTTTLDWLALASSENDEAAGVLRMGRSI